MTTRQLRKFLPFAPSFLLLIVIALPELSNAQQTCRPDGDVDQNGSVTAADALLAFQQALSLAPLSTCQVSIANVFPSPDAPDGNITASDALCIFQKALGLPSCLDTLPPEKIDEALTLPLHHGLAAGQFTVQPGAADEHGNVVVSCPPDGRACVVNVAADGSATYDGTGGAPTAMLAIPEEFPALPPQRVAHAVQAPIVDLDGTLYVGSDVAPLPPIELVATGTHDGIAVSYGRVRDGVGSDELIAYLNQQLDLEERTPRFSDTFAVQPIVRLTEAASDELTNDTLRAIQLINNALPHDSRLLFSSGPAPPRMPLQIPWGDVPEGQIFVDFSSPENPGHPAGTAYSQTQGTRRIRSYVLINPADTVDALELQTHSIQKRREQSEKSDRRRTSTKQKRVRGLSGNTGFQRRS